MLNIGNKKTPIICILPSIIPSEERRKDPGNYLGETVENRLPRKTRKGTTNHGTARTTMSGEAEAKQNVKQRTQR
jgi:hypothetical protein